MKKQQDEIIDEVPQETMGAEQEPQHETGQTVLTDYEIRITKLQLLDLQAEHLANISKVLIELVKEIRGTNERIDQKLEEKKKK